MADLKEIMDQASNSVDGKIVFKGLMVKIGVLKHGECTTPEDVLGFNYYMRDDKGNCWKQYIANPPLIGMTNLKPVECPLGVVAFDSYDVDYIGAIKALNQLDCGNVFTRITLSWPLTPEVKQPYWHIRTSIGNDISVGAFSGEPDCSSPIRFLYGMPEK